MGDIMAEDYTKKLQSLLRKLFQFESADLDFGIYRIMNKKRDVIEKFIEKDLIAAVDNEFGKVSHADKAQLLIEVEALAGKLGIGVDDDPAALRAMAKKVPALQPLITAFEQKRTDLLNLARRDEHKAEVFNHIYQFFSRYYDNGEWHRDPGLQIVGCGDVPGRSDYAIAIVCQRSDPTRRDGHTGISGIS